jgi:hypothetical protein
VWFWLPRDRKRRRVGRVRHACHRLHRNAQRPLAAERCKALCVHTQLQWSCSSRPRLPIVDRLCGLRAACWQLSGSRLGRAACAAAQHEPRTLRFDPVVHRPPLQATATPARAQPHTPPLRKPRASARVPQSLETWRKTPVGRRWLRRACRSEGSFCRDSDVAPRPIEAPRCAPAWKPRAIDAIMEPCAGESG